MQQPPPLQHPLEHLCPPRQNRDLATNDVLSEKAYGIKGELDKE